MRLAIITLAFTLVVLACGEDGSGPGQEATQLAFTAPPSTSTAGQVLTPAVQVSVEDTSGTLVSSAQNTVTLALGLNPSGATPAAPQPWTLWAGLRPFPISRSASQALGHPRFPRPEPKIP